MKQYTTIIRTIQGDITKVDCNCHCKRSKQLSVGRWRCLRRNSPCSGERVAGGLGGIGNAAVIQKVCDKIMINSNKENCVAGTKCGDSLVDDLLVLRDPLGVSKISVGKRTIHW